MKLLKQYSYGIVRIFVDQIAIAVFAVAVALAVAKTSAALTIASSIFSVLFFCYMVAELCFRQGVEDREKVQIGRCTENRLTGLYMGLFAAVPNALLALLYTILHLAGQPAAGLVRVIHSLVYGEYLGLLTIRIGGEVISQYPLTHFVILVPGILAAFLGYYIGVRGLIEPKPTKKDLE